MRIDRLMALVCAGLCAAPAFAAETVTYIYDAKGRLVQVVKSGGPTSGTVTVYEHDKADNRKNVKTTGAPN